MERRYKIYIITTEGCHACEIQVKNVKKALEETDRKIELEVRDFKEMPKDFLSEHFITDYPSTVMLINGKVRCVNVGTTSVNNIKEQIDVYLN